MNIIKINNKPNYNLRYSEDIKDLKEFLFEKMKKRKRIRIYWRGCSESARLLKNGTIKALGRMGSFNWNRQVIYKNFNTWFNESIIEEDVLNIKIS